MILALALVCVAGATGDIPPPARNGSFAPRLTSAGHGLWLSWLEPVTGEGTKGGSPLRLRAARLRAGRWSAPETVVERTDLFGNWADVPGVFETKGGDVYATWLQKSGGDPYAYDIYVGRRAAVGWSVIGRLHDDGVATEHGFVSAVAGVADVRFFWLDGREAPAGGPTTLRTARVAGGRIEGDRRVDDRVCDCCGTAAARSGAGARVVYRDRSGSEVRDIATLVVTARTSTASTPVASDGWQVPGCPVNGPALDERAGTTGAAWFTGAGGSATVRAAFLETGRFSAPILVEAEGALGRVDAVVGDGHELVVSSLVSREGHPDRAAVTLRRVARDGRVSAPYAVAETAAARPSGFPQMERSGSSVVVVWTDVESERTSLKATLVPLTALPPLQANALGLAVRPPRGVADSLPDLPLATLDRKSARLAQAGVRVVHLWATWCAPCLEEMPGLLAELRPFEQRGARLALIAVDGERTRSRVREHARAWHAQDRVLLDAEGVSEERLGASVVPSTFVYDGRGRLIWSASGKADPAALRRAVEDALSGQTQSP